MSEHPAPDVLARFARAELRGSELLAVDDHVAECAVCRAQLQSMGTVSLAADAWRSALAEDRNRTAAPRRMWLGLAAAAAIIAVVTTVLLTRQPERLQVKPSPGSTTRVPPHEDATIRDDGVTFHLSADGTVAALNATAAGTLQQLRRGVIPGATIAVQFAPQAERLRGGRPESGLAVTGPFGVIADDQPEFAWRDDDDPAKYKVDVVDLSYRRIAGSGEIAKRTWRPAKPLPRNITLEWQVTRHRGGRTSVSPEPPDPPARFRVISDSASHELRDAQAKRSHLLAALVYAREGMIDDAHGELAKLAALNPRSPLLQQLLATLDQEPEPTRTKPAQ